MAEPIRPLDIHFASGEIVTIDLDNLDAEPGAAMVDMLREGQCHVKAWVRLAIEYWKLGLVDVAMDIASNAVHCALLYHLLPLERNVAYWSVMHYLATFLVLKGSRVTETTLRYRGSMPYWEIYCLKERVLRPR